MSHPKYAPSSVRCCQHPNYEGFQRPDHCVPAHPRCAGCWVVWANASACILVEPDNRLLVRYYDVERLGFGKLRKGPAPANVVK